MEEAIITGVVIEVVVVAEAAAAVVVAGEGAVAAGDILIHITPTVDVRIVSRGSRDTVVAAGAVISSV